MTLPKNLQEKRDELAIEFQNAIWRLEPYKDPPDEGMCFKRGFHAALYLLLPEIKKLVEAMKFAAAEDMWESDGEYVESFSYQYKEWYQDKLDKALQSWQEFLGGESEGGDE